MNKETNSLYIPPFRDLRVPPEAEPPEARPSYDGWKLGALIGVATGLILVIVMGVGA